MLMQRIGFPNLYLFSSYDNTLVAGTSLADPGGLSRISDLNFFHPVSRICIKEFKYFTQKLFLSSRKFDPGCSSRIQIFYPSRIPDPGVNKTPEPGSGTLALTSVLVEKGRGEGVGWAGQVRVPGGTVHAHQQQAPVQRRH